MDFTAVGEPVPLGHPLRDLHVKALDPRARIWARFQR